MDGHNSMYNLLMGNNPVSTLPSSYNALGRTFGLSSNNGSDDNFFEKRRKSIDNAIGTTGAALYETGGNLVGAALAGLTGGDFTSKRSQIQNEKMENTLKNADQAERDILKKYGYNGRDEYYDKLDALEAAGDTNTYNELVNTVGKEINDLYSGTQKEQEKLTNEYNDYVQNNDVSKRINQDPGKFAGSAINTLSTAFDIMAPGAGVLANSVQGGIEGIADELEQNGLENFDWGRAGQNALIGTATGAVTGALNKGVSNKLAQNGGNLFKGGNKLTQGLNNLGSQTAVGRVGSTLATGAGRGALSGAAGGATGAGLSAALNGGDVIGSAIQGAQRGASQGALAGGIMAGANMAASKTPGIGDAMRKFNEAGEDWNARKANGESFGERLANTWDESSTKNALTNIGNKLKSGDAPVGLSIKNIPEAEVVPQDVQNMQVNNPNKAEIDNKYRVLPQDEVAMQKAETTKVGTAEDKNQPFMAYGESDLANRTKRGMVSNALERFGNTLEGAQTNVTRAARKDIGVKNAGETIEKVRKVTGITNMETQAQLARELTGGENSLMDRVQNNAIYTREDGTPYRVDTTPVIEDVENIVNKYADSNTFGSKKARDQFVYNLKKDIANESTDVLGVSNRMKANAADLRGKGVGEVPAKDKAQAKIYTDVAKKLDDLSYSAIPQENVDAMFDATINEMRARATQAANNNNRSVADAYTKLADGLDAQPRTVQAFRSFKKPFVDVAKIDDLSAMAENGAAAQMGRSFGGGIKRFINVAAQRPVNALLAKAGGAVNNIADKMADNSTAINSRYNDTNVGGNGSGVIDNASTMTLPLGATNVPSTRVYDAIGRTEGLTNAEQARTADYLINATQEANAQNTGNTLESLFGQPTTTTDTGVYNSIYGTTSPQNQTNSTQTLGNTANSYNNYANTGGMSSMSYYPQTGDYWTDIIGIAMTNSINDGDYDTFGALYEMYQSQLANLQKNSGKDYNNLTNWNSSDRTKLLSAQDALGQIDQLESAYNTATGGSGGNVIQGNLRSLAANISGGNLDPSANNYNKLAESVGMGIVKNLINLGVTEADAKRYLEYLPALTDTREQATQKLATLRNIYQTQINNLRSAYEV